MTGPEIVTMIKDVVLALCAVATAFAAVRGINKWAEEMRGKVEYELARSFITAVYRVRDQIEQIRSTIIFKEEFPKEFFDARQKGEARTMASGYQHVFRERFAPMWPILEKFDTHTLEAEALWGREMRTKARALRHEIRVLQVANESYVDDMLNNGENFKADHEFGRSTRATMFGSPGDESNAFTRRISECVADIEAAVKPHLRAPAETLKPWDRVCNFFKLKE